MAKLFDALNRLKKIEEITSTKDDVPPVYLMDEVVDLAKESTDAANSVAEHINRNLTNRNPVVKWKALKLIKHLCNKGCSQFQRSMQRYSGSIRELVNYKGEPDPFKGDALNQRVRELAQEVMQVLYAHQSYQAPTQGGVSLQGRIQGFGSSSAPPTASSTSSVAAGLTSWAASGVSRMMAFGSSAASGGGGGADNNRAGFMGNSQTMGTGHTRNGSLGEPVLGSGRTGNNTGSFGPTGNSGSFGPLAGSAAQAQPTSAAFGSNTGGSFGPLGGRTGGAGGGGGGGGDAGWYRGGSGGGGGGGNGGLGSEEALVDSMCAGGGLRPVPSADDLNAFVQAVSASDGLKVAELMIAKLSSDKWQVVLRTLCALEAILNQGLTQACGEVAVMFQSDPTPVHAATTNPNAQVRQQAAKCIKLLTGADVDISITSPTNTRVSTAAMAAAAGAGGGGAGPAASVSPAPAAPSPLDLLGDLADDLPPAIPVAPAPATVPAVPAAAPSAVQDPFALMDALHPPATTVPAPVPAPVPAAVPAVPAPAARPALDDLFADFSSAPASVQPVTAAPPSAGLSGFGLGLPQAGGPGLGMHGMGGASPLMQQQQQPAPTGVPGMGAGMMGYGAPGNGAVMSGMGQGLGGPPQAPAWTMPAGGVAGMSGLGGAGAAPGVGQIGGGAAGAGGFGQAMRPSANAQLGKPAADSFDFVKSAFK